MARSSTSGCTGRVVFVEEVRHTPDRMCGNGNQKCRSANESYVGSSKLSKREPHQGTRGNCSQWNFGVCGSINQRIKFSCRRSACCRDLVITCACDAKSSLLSLCISLACLGLCLDANEQVGRYRASCMHAHGAGNMRHCSQLSRHSTHGIKAPGFRRALGRSVVVSWIRRWRSSLAFSWLFAPSPTLTSHVFQHHASPCRLLTFTWVTRQEDESRLFFGMPGGQRPM